ncbi:hypothetical protein BjapCC829_07640 [Bradyrhizobium barranii]|uniref:Uncharacterized protein n=1 Tax=Bradyrhizobium barranii TaxID=2992140 RepID=A0ABY3QRU8_9BRAD|nr:hypothetical protein [Bradyrhizobium japonicum]UFW88403.1 hypothetical protein BjapCC829_07640 [Bradyrhizobium japonicum]
MREILSAAAELGPAPEKKAGVVDRIEKIEKDQTAFGDEVTAICGEMSIPAHSGTVLDLAQHIGDRVRDASADHARRAKAMDNLEDARRRGRSLAETLAVHKERKSRMIVLWGLLPDRGRRKISGRCKIRCRGMSRTQRLKSAKHYVCPMSLKPNVFSIVPIDRGWRPS